MRSRRAVDDSTPKDEVGRSAVNLEKNHFGVNWRFVNTGHRRGSFNMEYDEYLARRLLEGRGEPTVRVYGWEPYAISLGYHQREDEIDHERCAVDGIDIVRRPTGGRAILHAHELTYSVLMYPEGRSVAQSYEYIGEALVLALRYLDVNAEMSKINLNFSEMYSDGSSISCFASTSRSEIQYRGKKIIGSAQRRYSSPDAKRGTVLLQHGSLLLGPQHRRFVEYIVNPRTQAVLQTVLEHKTTEVESILQRPVSFDEAVEAVQKGFEDAWGIGFVEEEVEPDAQSIVLTS